MDWEKGRAQKTPRQGIPDGVLRMNPAMTYFRTGGHYHRPQKLNCRVRNGNECFLQGMFTGKTCRH